MYVCINPYNIYVMLCYVCVYVKFVSTLLLLNDFFFCFYFLANINDEYTIFLFVIFL